MVDNLEYTINSVDDYSEIDSLDLEKIDLSSSYSDSSMTIDNFNEKVVVESKAGKYYIKLNEEYVGFLDSDEEVYNFLNNILDEIGFSGNLELSEDPDIIRADEDLAELSGEVISGLDESELSSIPLNSMINLLEGGYISNTRTETLLNKEIFRRISNMDVDKINFLKENLSKTNIKEIISDGTIGDISFMNNFLDDFQDNFGNYPECDGVSHSESQLLGSYWNSFDSGRENYGELLIHAYDNDYSKLAEDLNTSLEFSSSLNELFDEDVDVSILEEGGIIGVIDHALEQTNMRPQDRQILTGLAPVAGILAAGYALYKQAGFFKGIGVLIGGHFVSSAVTGQSLVGLTRNVLYGGSISTGISQEQKDSIQSNLEKSEQENSDYKEKVGSPMFISMVFGNKSVKDISSFISTNGGNISFDTQEYLSQLSDDDPNKELIEELGDDRFEEIVRLGFSSMGVTADNWREFISKNENISFMEIFESFVSKFEEIEEIKNNYRVLDSKKFNKYKKEYFSGISEEFNIQYLIDNGIIEEIQETDASSEDESQEAPSRGRRRGTSAGGGATAGAGAGSTGGASDESGADDTEDTDSDETQDTRETTEQQEDVDALLDDAFSNEILVPIISMEEGRNNFIGPDGGINYEYLESVNPEYAEKLRELDELGAKLEDFSYLLSVLRNNYDSDIIDNIESSLESFMDSVRSGEKSSDDFDGFVNSELNNFSRIIVGEEYHNGGPGGRSNINEHEQIREGIEAIFSETSEEGRKLALINFIKDEIGDERAAMEYTLEHLSGEIDISDEDYSNILDVLQKRDINSALNWFDGYPGDADSLPDKFSFVGKFHEIFEDREEFEEFLNDLKESYDDVLEGINEQEGELREKAREIAEENEDMSQQEAYDMLREMIISQSMNIVFYNSVFDYKITNSDDFGLSRLGGYNGDNEFYSILSELNGHGFRNKVSPKQLATEIGIQVLAIGAGVFTGSAGFWAINAARAGRAGVGASRMIGASRLNNSFTRWVGSSAFGGSSFYAGYGGAMSAIEGENMYSMRGLGESIAFYGAFRAVGGVFQRMGKSINPNLPLSQQRLRFATQTTAEGIAISGVAAADSLIFDEGEWSASDMLYAIVLAGAFRGAERGGRLVARRNSNGEPEIVRARSLVEGTGRNNRSAEFTTSNGRYKIEGGQIINYRTGKPVRNPEQFIRNNYERILQNSDQMIARFNDRKLSDMMPSNVFNRLKERMPGIKNWTVARFRDHFNGMGWTNTMKDGYVRGVMRYSNFAATGRQSGGLGKTAGWTVALAAYEPIGEGFGFDMGEDTSVTKEDWGRGLAEAVAINHLGILGAVAVAAVEGGRHYLGGDNSVSTSEHQQD